MATAKAFPIWRDSWADIDGIKPLLSKADELIRRRSHGNQLVPKIVVPPGADIGLSLAAVRNWSSGKPPADVSGRPIIAARIFESITPILRSAAWPRWLYLERAFLDGSQSGDLLFSALIIRTMCEEVQKLQVLDLSSAEVQRLAASESDADNERFEGFLRTVLQMLDEAEDPRQFKHDSDPVIAPANATLQSAKQALNDYVHPNYGSHVAALFPERAAAARIVLEGIIAVHAAFFELSWAELPMTGACSPTGVAPFENLDRVKKRFIKIISREGKKPLQAPNLSEAGAAEIKRIFEGPATLRWLNVDPTDSEEILDDSEISELIGSLRRLDGSEGKTTLSRGHGRYRLWEGATAQDILSLVWARRADQILTEAFPNGAPNVQEQQRWLNFSALALQLAMTLTVLKVASFKAQLVRQTVSRNPLGALLCIRSLIEHKAVTNWLITRLGTQWIELGKRVKPSTDLPAEAEKLSDTLARFLSGTKGSAEIDLPWRLIEEQGRRELHLSLPDIVKNGLQKASSFQTAYNIASAALHGRYYRGIDLSAQAARGGNDGTGLSALILEWICDPDELMDQWAPAGLIFQALEHAAQSGGAKFSGKTAEVKGAFGHFEGKLKSGRDFTGDGSETNPFRFRRHLQFHSASYRLLSQLGFEGAPRRHHVDAHENLYDVYHCNNVDLWFAASPEKLN